MPESPYNLMQTTADKPDPYSGDPIPQVVRTKERMKFPGGAPDMATQLQQMVYGGGLPWYKRAFNQMVDQIPDSPWELIPVAGMTKFKKPAKKVLDLTNYKNTRNVVEKTRTTPKTEEEMFEQIKEAKSRYRKDIEDMDFSDYEKNKSRTTEYEDEVQNIRSDYSTFKKVKQSSNGVNERVKELKKLVPDSYGYVTHDELTRIRDSFPGSENIRIQVMDGLTRQKHNILLKDLEEYTKWNGSPPRSVRIIFEED